MVMQIQELSVKLDKDTARIVMADNDGKRRMVIVDVPVETPGDPKESELKATAKLQAKKALQDAIALL